MVLYVLSVTTNSLLADRVLYVRTIVSRENSLILITLKKDRIPQWNNQGYFEAIHFCIVKNIVVLS